MSLFSIFNIAASGLSARRAEMDVISNNIVNAETTRTTEGGPYRRQRVIFRPVNEMPNQQSYLFPDLLRSGVGEGVKVVRIEDDKSPGRFRWDPTHSDAIQFGQRKGYVELPNVNIVTEMTDFINASRAYQASATLIQNAKRMYSSAVQIGMR